MRSVIAALVAAMTVMTLSVPAGGASAGPPRIELNVLVVTDGMPWVEGIHQQLTSEGVPTTVVDLSSGTRPLITSGFLADQLADGTPRAKFQGVVLPNDAPSGLSTSERSALASFEQDFNIRQVDSYVYPNANVGQNAPSWSGSLDGSTAMVTTSAKADVLRYLNGPLTFEGQAGGDGSYGHLATPLADDPAAGTHFEPYLTGTIPGTSTTGTLAGVFTKAGRQQLVINFAYNYYQQQFRFLAHGIVDWVTRGVHLGYWRNYFSVHIDDLFSSDSRWSDVGKCTPGEGDCASNVPTTTPIRMTSADVTASAAWQQQHNYRMSFMFNGAGSAQAGGASDPLTTALLARKDSFWWTNHTYEHLFLGCVQDFTVIPWRCQTDAGGNIVWTDQKTIDDEIGQNLKFASDNGLPIRPNELLGGEHSGTKILPQQPVDNPNFAATLTKYDIGWIGLDASREPVMRQVGSALGVPRHPINVFYNVGTTGDEVSEYNWIYTSKVDGGSGLCETTPGTTCITPLDPVTGWSSYILPLQVKITLGYVMSNDPRPFYMHQANLAQDRLALQAMGGVLSAYRDAFAGNTPVLGQTMTDSAKALQQQTSWHDTQSAKTVSGHVQGTTLTVQGPAGTSVPITAPAGTTVKGGAAFGDGYAGEQSAYTAIGSSPTTLTTPTTAYSTVAAKPSSSEPLAMPATPAPVIATTRGTGVTITDAKGTTVLPRMAATPPAPIDAVAASAATAKAEHRTGVGAVPRRTR
jgi:hypothetical protein